MITAIRAGFCLALVFVVGLLNNSLLHADSGDLISHSFDRVPALQNDTRVRKVSMDLEVNPDSSHRLVVPNKCITPGEVELKRLARTSNVEESYVYVPSLCLWIETGYGETYKTVRLDTEFVDKLLRDYPSIVIYHIHVGTSGDIAEYLPAFSDMVSLVLINTKFFADPSVKIEHRAMTYLGVIDYSFVLSQDTERLLEKLRHTGLGDFVAQNIAYEFNRDVHRKNYYSAVRDCIDSSNSNSNNFIDCFPIRADDFVLQYRPVADADYVVNDLRD